MASYTQAGRPLRIDSVLGDDVLLLSEFSGDEAISAPFLFRLGILSTDAAIDATALLRTAAVVHIRLSDGGERKIHGLIRRFVQEDRQADLIRYRADLVPWFWFLSLSRECRIYQNLTVPEIVEKVFKDQGYNDFEVRCTKTYPKREYCVQYRESHLDFVSRLLEEEGIFYFFEHSDSRHVLVLADSNTSVAPCPDGSIARIGHQAGLNVDVIASITAEYSVHIGKVALKDYDHLQPSLSLEGTMAGSGREEVYDYPGKYTQLEEGERYARLRLEAEEAQRHIVRGQGTCRTFQSGYRFDLKGHYRPDANVAYRLTRVVHHATAGDYIAAAGPPDEYRNEFVAIPIGVAYVPARVTPRPVVRGSQTALVVGTKGEELMVDRYGRVKIQFYWDRDGKKDENSSCWVRVSTAWAGKGWGTIHVPRIGQEVIVDFLEGDPDRPIITGRVYNAEQLPPYPLPGESSRSGIRSRSTKGGGTENFNEIRMDDRKGAEVLYIHAEKDQSTAVENDRSESIGHDETVTIGNDRTESVGNDESIDIGANRAESVARNESITIGENRTQSVGKNESVDIGQNRTQTVGKNEDLTVGDKRTTQVGKDDTLQVGKNLVVNAGDQIVLQTGSASITMKKNGDITIKGKNISINASGKFTGKASSDVVLKGSKILSN